APRHRSPRAALDAVPLREPRGRLAAGTGADTGPAQRRGAPRAARSGPRRARPPPRRARDRQPAGHVMTEHDWGFATELEDVAGAVAIAGVGESEHSNASGRTAREIASQAVER